MEDITRDRFAEKALEILKENKSDYAEDFQRMKERSENRLNDYEGEEDMREQLSKEFQEQGRIQDREKLLDILYWKLNPRNYASAENQSKEKDSIEDIKKASGRAFAVDEAEKSLEALTELAGVGPAVASTILMFYKPEKYTVLDQHAWRAAVELGMNAEKKEAGFSCEEYARYNEFCHGILHDINESQEHEMLDLRQLDLALHSLGGDM